MAIHIHVGKKTVDADPISTRNLDPEQVKKERRDDKRILSNISQNLKQLSYWSKQKASRIETEIDKLLDQIDDRQ
jgi:hypothetical protein